MTDVIYPAAEIIFFYVRQQFIILIRSYLRKYEKARVYLPLRVRRWPADSVERLFLITFKLLEFV